MSFGFLILGEVIPNDSEGANYLNFVAKEISRVTPNEGITFHVNSSHRFSDHLKREGFTLWKCSRFIFGIKGGDHFSHKKIEVASRYVRSSN